MASENTDQGTSAVEESRALAAPKRRELLGYLLLCWVYHATFVLLFCRGDPSCLWSAEFFGWTLFTLFPAAVGFWCFAPKWWCGAERMKLALRIFGFQELFTLTLFLVWGHNGQLFAIALGFPAVVISVGLVYAKRVRSGPPRRALSGRQEFLAHACFTLAAISSTLLLFAVISLLSFSLTVFR